MPAQAVSSFDEFLCHHGYPSSHYGYLSGHYGIFVATMAIPSGHYGYSFWPLRLFPGHCGYILVPLRLSGHYALLAIVAVPQIIC